MDCVFFFVVVGLQLDTSVLPQWLKALLTEKFFNACLIHEDAKKNEKNVFCLDCFEGICPHCLPPHSSHRLLQVPLFFSFFFKLKFTRISFNSLRDIYIHTYICMEFISFLFVCYNVIQIRRYVYHDVLRLDDAEKLMDCDFVQVSWRQQTIYKLIWEFQGFYLIVNFSFFFFLCFESHTQPTRRRLYSWIKGLKQRQEEVQTISASYVKEPFKKDIFSAPSLARSTSKIIVSRKKPSFIHSLINCPFFSLKFLCNGFVFTNFFFFKLGRSRYSCSCNIYCELGTNFPSMSTSVRA